MASKAAVVALCLAAALSPAAADINGIQNVKQRQLFCGVYQWVCKLTCQQSCCHIPVGGPWLSGPRCFCSENEARKSGKAVQFCCGGEGPVHDPIFSDLQGRRWEFFGEPGSIYNVYSHPQHSVNMRLVHAGDRHIRQQEGGGTFADALAFKLPDGSQVLVEITELGDMIVAIDDEDQDLDQPFVYSTKIANVSFAPYAERVGEQLNISTDLFSYNIKGVRAFADDITGYNRGHLDLTTEILSPPGDLDGLLGATLYVKPEDRLEHSGDHSFHDAGRESAYLVEGLFDAMALRKSSSRRRSLIEGAALDGLKYPLSATLSLAL